MASSSGFVPRRRPQGLVAEHLEGETLLYVEPTHRAFCLNPPAARVWNAIDGRRDVDAISRQVELDTELVLGTLREMGEAGRSRVARISWDEVVDRLTEPIL